MPKLLDWESLDWGLCSSATASCLRPHTSFSTKRRWWGALLVCAVIFLWLYKDLSMMENSGTKFWANIKQRKHLHHISCVSVCSNSYTDQDWDFECQWFGVMLAPHCIAIVPSRGRLIETLLSPVCTHILCLSTHYYTMSTHTDLTVWDISYFVQLLSDSI